MTPPKWINKLLGLLCLTGIGLSVYSLIHHLKVGLFGATDAACNVSSSVNCDQVAASPFSELFGIPLGVWGLAFFLATGYALFQYYRGKTKDNPAGVLVIGSLVCVVLALISITQIGSICLACVGIYLTTFAMAGLFFYYEKPWPALTKPRPYLTAVAVTAMSLSVYAMSKGTILKSIETSELSPKEPNELTASVLEYNTVYEDILRPSQLQGDFAKGRRGAKIQLVEFADFQCPSCAHFSVVISQIVSEFSDDIHYVFKNFPLDNKCNSRVTAEVHKYACFAAAMAHCAGEYGKFWEFHDQVFAKMGKISEREIDSISTSLGLPLEHMNACRQAASTRNKIENDINAGIQLEIRGTPTLFINGRRYTGTRTVEAIRAVIQSLL